MRVEGQFAAVGEILEQIVAVVENLFVFDAESFRYCVEGVFGPE